MKYSFMSFSTPDLTLPETLVLAGKLGYEGIEPRTGRNHLHGIELERSPQERRGISNLARDNGIEICCLALSTKYSDPGASDSMVEETRRYIELASDIHCPRLRVFGGMSAEGVSPEEAADTVTDAMIKLGPAAQAAGITICLETHDAWTSPDRVAQVMRRANHPHIAVNWDVMHPFRTSKVPMRQAWLTLKPWLHHVHVHDGTLADPLVLKPCGDGEIDIEGALECLLEMGYEEYISGEWIDSRDTIDLGEEIRRLRTLEQQVRQKMLERS